ncbi:MAG: succinate dehydrogenase cytochrome b subunit [Acidobacteria bacterium]|nr:succinate dehydrogenase cytochrome b subunit [Acidobacteriota bacterium]
MSATATALAAKASERTSFYDSTVGKKVIMAVTGLILFVFVVGHMIGNLQVYLGPEKLDSYAKLLRGAPALLWGVRIVLLASVVLHTQSAISLAWLKAKARPVAYIRKRDIGSTFASRTMLLTGLTLSAFIVYHVLHFTTGTLHGEFREGMVYHNLVTGFRQVPVSIAYIVAMLFLGTHLYHGAWSMFQSVGISHPRYTPLLKRFAAIAAAAIVLGNCSIPIAVLAGLVK